MKALLLLLALVPQSGALTIEKGAIGPLRIGMTESAVLALFPPDRRRLIMMGTEDGDEPFLALTLPGSKVRDGVIVEFLDSPGKREVERLLIKDPAARTIKGVGVGSTVAELRAAYTIDLFGNGEGSVYMFVGELSASFQLDQSGPLGHQLALLKDPRDVAGSIKIEGILLTGIK